MTSDQPHSKHVFEAKAGPLPKLKSAAAAPAEDPLDENEAPAVAGLRAKRRRQAGAASREVVLRIVEAVKAL
jgi:hypothetical protein